MCLALLLGRTPRLPGRPTLDWLLEPFFRLLPPTPSLLLLPLLLFCLRRTQGRGSWTAQLSRGTVRPPLGMVRAATYPRLGPTPAAAAAAQPALLLVEGAEQGLQALDVLDGAA